MKTPKTIFRELCEEAEWKRFVYEDHINSCRRRGEPLPEHLLPGRFIERQSKEVREALRQLKSDDVKSQGGMRRWV